MALRVGVEIGGTFTDLVAFRDGAVQVAKVPSTPSSPDIGAFNAIDAASLKPSDMADLGHGSTVATNAVLERKGARVAFVTTAGFRDVLFLARHTRRNIYDLHYKKPAPVVRRADCFEVSERVLSDGSVETKLDEAAIMAQLLPALRQGHYDAIAICLLNAYANDTHERRVTALIQTDMPDMFVTGSADVIREFREYERASTTTPRRLCTAGDRPVPQPDRAAPGREQLHRPLHRHAIKWRSPSRCRHASKRHHRPVLRPCRRCGRSSAPSGALWLQRSDHLRHGRYVHRRLPRRQRPARNHAGYGD